MLDKKEQQYQALASWLMYRLDGYRNHRDMNYTLPNGMSIIVYGVVFGILLTEQELQNAQELLHLLHNKQLSHLLLN